jgi:glycosyltransferase 2 family protein
MATRNLLRWAGAALGLAVFAVLVWRLAPHADALALAWRRLSAADLALAFAAFLAAQAAFAWSWHRLLHAAGETGEFIGDAARWSVSLAGKYFPGKVWQAVARYGLYHGGARGARVAPAYLREMLLGASAAMACVTLGAPWLGAQARPLAWIFGTGALVLALLAAPGVGMRVAAVAARWLPGHVQLADTRWRAMLVAWGWQALAYGLLGLGFFALGRGLGWFEARHIGLAIAALCFGGLAGIAAFFVPAGIGVREAAIAWILAPVIGAGPALLLAVLARAWISLGEAVLVIVGLAWLQRHGKPATTP